MNIRFVYIVYYFNNFEIIMNWNKIHTNKIKYKIDKICIWNILTMHAILRNFK